LLRPNVTSAVREYPNNAIAYVQSATFPRFHVFGTATNLLHLYLRMAALTQNR